MVTHNRGRWRFRFSIAGNPAVIVVMFMPVRIVGTHEDILLNPSDCPERAPRPRHTEQAEV
jgi:hypothetical protein